VRVEPHYYEERHLPNPLGNAPTFPAQSQAR